MLKVTIRCPVRAGAVEEFLYWARQLAAKARLEPGCLSYELLQDRQNPNVIALSETWDAQSSLDAHLGTDYFRELAACCVALQEGEPEYRFYEPVG